MTACFKNGIKPAGEVRLPPSKSEAIRAALLLGACGADPIRAVGDYKGVGLCDDIRCALEASRTFMSGRAYVGGSAALLRMLLPIMVMNGGACVTGEERVLDRGVGELEDCFRTKAIRNGDTLIMGSTPELLSMTRFTLDCSRSSQFLSGLMIALPRMEHDCEIIIKGAPVSKPYAMMTLDFVRRFGGNIDETETGFVTHPSRYSAPDVIYVTGDLSYAAVFRAMNRLGGKIDILGASPDTLQPDAAFERLAELDDLDVTDCPDIMPLLAVCACARERDTVIRGTARLRTKESDREAGVVKLINDLGGRAEAGEDRVIIHGTGGLGGGFCRTQGDHRLVFAAALAAVISAEPVVTENAECVSKSAPDFLETADRLFSK